MYFTISLNVPQPPPYPLIWLFLPRVDFHWNSMVGMIGLGRSESNIQLSE